MEVHFAPASVQRNKTLYWVISLPLRATWFARDLVRLIRSWFSFRKTGITDEFSYLFMRRLYCMTNGRFNDVIAVLNRIHSRPYDLSNETGLLGKGGGMQVDAIVNAIKRDGFVALENILPSSTCDEIELLARNELCVPLDDHTEKAAPLPYSSLRPVSARYNFRERDLLKNSRIQELITDLSLLAAAQRYFSSLAIQDLVAMWWSTPRNSAPDFKAAQLFHFDMDRIKFLKFFFYLTDVDMNNGPHCYVRGSHLRKPRKILQDRRILDEEIECHYRKEDIVPICGKRGSLIIADTRGYHKGMLLKSGERLIFQIEYAISLFGTTYERYLRNDLALTEKTSRTIQRYPATFQRYL